MEDHRVSVSDMVSSDEQASLSASEPCKTVSRERWYGVWLLVGISFIGFVVIGGLGWWGYSHMYLAMRHQGMSIVQLSQIKSDTTQDTTIEEGVVSEVISGKVDPPLEFTSASDALREPILVLNGGGVKGSAGEVSSVLKKAGYQNVTLGNTKKNYTGVTVYFAAEKDGVASEIKKILLKQYPKTTSQGAVAGDSETSGGAVVIIIGK